MKQTILDAFYATYPLLLLLCFIAVLTIKTRNTLTRRKIMNRKVSIMELRNSAKEMTLRINKLGGVRAIKNEIVMLKHIRTQSSDSPVVVADYENRILAKQWSLTECEELESSRDEVYTEMYLRGF
tara:strand:- start:491 stop:868 length:378 start_codon:yes stop_codon:yes gene_type:complete